MDIAEPSADPAAAIERARGQRRGGRQRGWLITDNWATGPKPGKQYTARVRDKHAGRYKCQQFSDRADAERWAKETRKQIDRGLVSAVKVSLTELAGEYATFLEQGGASAQHVREVRRVAALAAAARLDDPTQPLYAKRLIDWLGSLKAMETNGEGARFAGRTRRRTKLDLTARTRNAYLTRIRTLLLHGVRTQRLPRDPLAVLPRRRAFTEPEKLKPVFTIAELRALLDPSRESDPFFLPFALMTYTGCRVAEILFLRCECVRLADGVIDVRGASEVQRLAEGAAPIGYRLKFDRERSVPIQGELRSILAMMMQRDIGWALDGVKSHRYVPADPRQPARMESYGDSLRRDPRKLLWNEFRAYLARCGVQVRGRSPHSCRHTFTALMIATGYGEFRLADDLGHRSLIVTKKYAQATKAYDTHVRGWPAGELRIRQDESMATRHPATG